MQRIILMSNVKLNPASRKYCNFNARANKFMNSHRNDNLLKLRSLNEIKYIKNMHEYLTNLTCLVFMQRKTILTLKPYYFETSAVVNIPVHIHTLGLLVQM